MDILNKPIQIDTFILIAAGLIMAMTLYLSKKARTVTRTEVGLGSQEEVYEIFQSNAIARSLVRMVLFFSNMFNNLIPLTIKNWIRKRFSREKMQFNADEKGELPAFDLIRASVIIMVSTALISLGTSLKLPLSTTYVTFIVAMAAALSDRAWGRDSAVYRVSGVVTVVGGWFLTSLIAIIASFILATIIFFGKIYAIIILVALATFIYLRTNQYHKNKQKELRAHEKKIISRYKAPEEMILGLADDIENYLTKTFDILLLTLKGIVKGDLKQLKKAFKQNSKNLESLRLMLDNILLTSRFNTDESIESSQFHIKSIAALNTIADRLSYITKHNFNYFDNHHNQLNNEQSTEIKQIISQLDKFNSHLLSLFENYDFNKLTLLQEIEKSILADTSKFIKNQLKRMKKPNMNLKRSRLFISNLENTNTIVKNTSEILIFSNEINSMIK
jgi:hypothetical protein